MKIYRPQNSWEDEYRLHVPSMTVQERDASPVFSGLYDADGNKLMVSEEKLPIGFITFEPK